MKSFTSLTMKSKQAWMKSKFSNFDEIKSVFISAVGDFICEADFIHEVDLFRRKTDLVEKSTNLVSRLMLFSGGDEESYFLCFLLYQSFLQSNPKY